VPAAWLGGADAPQVYAEYLSRRIASAEFAAEAERARVAGA
jgi:hypothetical protein